MCALQCVSCVQCEAIHILLFRNTALFAVDFIYIIYLVNQKCIPYNENLEIYTKSLIQMLEKYNFQVHSLSLSPLLKWHQIYNSSN